MEGRGGGARGRGEGEGRGGGTKGKGGGGQGLRRVTRYVLRGEDACELGIVNGSITIKVGEVDELVHDLMRERGGEGESKVRGRGEGRGRVR